MHAGIGIGDVSIPLSSILSALSVVKIMDGFDLTDAKLSDSKEIVTVEACAGKSAAVASNSGDGNTTTDAASSTLKSSGDGSGGGAIAGAVIGSLVGVALIAGAGFFIY